MGKIGISLYFVRHTTSTPPLQFIGFPLLRPHLRSHRPLLLQGDLCPFSSLEFNCMHYWVFNASNIEAFPILTSICTPIYANQCNPIISAANPYCRFQGHTDFVKFWIDILLSKVYTEMNGKVRDVVISLKIQHELLSVYATQLLEKEHPGCRALLRDDKVVDFSRMYKLFSKIPQGLDPVTSMFKYHVG